MPTPILSVGNAAIDLAPPFLKDFAIEQFGTADKTVLLAGIYTVVAAGGRASPGCSGCAGRGWRWRSPAVLGALAAGRGGHRPHVAWRSCP